MERRSFFKKIALVPVMAAFATELAFASPKPIPKKIGDIHSYVLIDSDGVKRTWHMAHWDIMDKPTGIYRKFKEQSL